MSGSLSSFSAISISSLLYATLALSIARLTAFGKYTVPVAVTKTKFEYPSISSEEKPMHFWISYSSRKALNTSSIIGMVLRPEIVFGVEICLTDFLFSSGL